MEEKPMLVTRAEFDEAISKLATKADLGNVVDAFVDRIAQNEQRMTDRFVESEQRMIERMTELIGGSEQRMIKLMTELISGSEQRMLAEIGRHTTAIEESMRPQIGIVDDKYADLPARVTRLETAVFTPKRRRRS